MVGMYDLSKVFLLCVREMKEAGIPVQEGRVAEKEAGHIEGCLWLCNDPNCYGFAIVCAVLVATGHGLPATALIGVAIGLHPGSVPCLPQMPRAWGKMGEVCQDDG